MLMMLMMIMLMMMQMMIIINNAYVDGHLIILLTSIFSIVDTHIVKQIKAICCEHADQGSKDVQNLEKIFLTKSPMQALYNLEVCGQQYSQSIL